MAVNRRAPAFFAGVRFNGRRHWFGKICKGQELMRGRRRRANAVSGQKAWQMASGPPIAPVRWAVVGLVGAPVASDFPGTRLPGNRRHPVFAPRVAAAPRPTGLDY